MTDPEKRPGQIILGWWSETLGRRETGVQRGLAARLRRGDAIAVLCEGEVHDLGRELGLVQGAEAARRLVRLARVLAQVREHVGAVLPRQLGAGAPPAMSKARFEKLIRAEGDELEAALRRALPVVNDRTNVAALGEALLHWTEPTRTRWCFDYYRTEFTPAPSDAAEPTTEDVSQ